MYAKLYITIFLLFFQGVASTFASNYHIDPAHGENVGLGTIEKPWKDFTVLNNKIVILKPGDSLLLKRGELFFEVLDLRCQGSANAPIVITGYGSATKHPVFIYQAPASDQITVESFRIRLNNSQYVKLSGIEITDDHINALDHHVIAHVKIGVSIENSNFISVENCTISKVGIGVNVNGDHNLIRNCKISNLRMVRNTIDAENDDYGANALVIHGAANVVEHNFFSECWAYSADYEFDGGAVEMFGAGTSNNIITGNTAINCNGFLEFGSDNGGSMENNKVYNNLVVNCSDLLYINNAGEFTVTVKKLFFENNISIQLFAQLTKPKTMILMRKASSEREIIVLRNNFFWITAEMDLLKEGQFTKETLSHSGNVYYLPSGKLNLTAGPSDSVLTAGSAVFQVPGESLTGPPETYPFKYLLPLIYRWLNPTSKK